MQISRKLPIAAVFMTLFAVAATSMGGLYVAGKANVLEVEDKLVALATGKKNEMRQYFGSIDKDIAFVSDSKMTKDALEFITFEYELYENKARELLQQRYITDNPNPQGQRHLLINPDIDVYDNVHAHYHGYFARLVDEYGYDDVFLVDASGNVIYSASKGLDFATNLVSGEWAGSNLANAYNAALKLAAGSKPVLTDLLPYGPSNGEPAAFISSPVFKGDTLLGVVALRLPPQKISQILAGREGLGETGETLLLNAQGMMLSNSNFTTQNDTLSQQINSPLLQEASTAGSAVGTLEGYRGIAARAAVSRFEFGTHQWYIIALIDESEAFVGLTRMQNVMLILALVVSLLCLVASIIFSRTITRPINDLAGKMRHLAQGNTDVELDDSRSDEIGEMARSVTIFRDAARENIRLETEAEANRHQSDSERAERESAKQHDDQCTKQAVDALAEGLERLANGDVSRTIDIPFKPGLESLRENYNNTAIRLRSTLTSVQESTASLRNNANEVRVAADDLARRTEQQAASLEETSAALEEITVTVNTSTERAEEARSKVSATKDAAEQSGEVVNNAMSAMQRIETASLEISNIINVIDEIAFQTNLLALNAGVEAARAGDAGRGFAVVAQEVRELAQRSATAAKDIKSLITKSGEEVKSGVDLVNAAGSALSRIGKDVILINDHVKAIVTGAREQAMGIQGINSAISQMDQTTQQNAAMVEQTNAVSHMLASDSDSLAQIVEQFKLESGAEYRDNSVAQNATARGRHAKAKEQKMAFDGNAALAVQDEWSEFYVSFAR